MHGITVRAATKNDIPILLEFEQGVVNAERPFDPTLRREATRYYDLPALLASPNVHLVVAEWQGQPVGSGYVRIEEAKPYLQHPVHGYLGFMYVVPQQRGKGINRLVMQALEAWAKTQGITELRLEVYHQNAAAIAAYEKVGFQRHMVEMRKVI